LRQLSKSILLLFIAVLFLIFLSVPIGPVPPLGKFLDPAVGFWSVVRQNALPSKTGFTIAGLQHEVTVIIDRRGVLHIFGDSEQDVFAAFGYLQAKDRLWQMDIQYRFAAGRLAEILGKWALARDIYQRKLGLLVTAQQTTAQLDSSCQEYQMLQAFVGGINQFIRKLSYRDYPYEFKLLNYQPEPWTIEKVVMVNVMMGYLSRTMEDFRFSNLPQLFSSQEIAELYPLFSPVTCPIIPESGQTSEPEEIAAADSPDAAGKLNFEPDFATPVWNHSFAEWQEFGSNNWVVAGSKTATGKPILANDPHLGLDLPSVWYEAHLNCPGFDVYGVTLVGEPFVVIGFNRHIAWGMTNSGWDVTDFYRETFDNRNHDHYRFNGSWQPVKKIPQTIHVKDAPDTTITLEYTHRGPVLSRDNEFYSMSWTGNQTHFDGVAVYRLNKAKNYEEFREALKFYHCPAQNFIYADVEGNIAITCAGKNPIRNQGKGRIVRDGSDDRFDWIGYTPFARLPFSLNPKQGYLASANQQPLNRPEPYFGWRWPSTYRARRIKALLEQSTVIDVKDMMKFQTDVYAVRAGVFVPYIIRAFDRSPLTAGQEKIDSVLFYLKNWNYEMSKDQVGATIFERFMRNFKINTWADHFPEHGKRYLVPGESVLERLTTSNPDSKWFDDTRTPAVENRDDIIRKSLVETVRQLTEELGPAVSHWQWKRYHRTMIPHLSRLKPLGIAPFPNDGGTGTLNVGPGRTNSFGPSWRMIVSLTEPIRAWGVYPGGQSGNPASKHYCDFLDTWKNKQYFELLFPKTPSDIAPDMIETRMTFSAGGSR